jgi:DUF4097 and DUF4098 domain-containing protein YvlB
MPTFDTPTPIDVDLEIGVGDIRIEASDRADTVVDVRPTDPDKPADVKAAEQTRVEFTGDRLLVKGPSGWRQWVSHRSDSIDVTIALPVGSRVQAEAAVGALRADGRLGECRAKVGVGDVHLDETGPLNLRTGAGDVGVARVAGKAEVVTGSGAVRLGHIDGTTWVKNSNGDTTIDEAGGEARVRAANGTISIERAREGVVAKTANGRVHVGEVTNGTAVAESAFGDLEIGVRDGVSAWLDLHTKFGRVRNELDASERPASGQSSVEVRAHTSMGDIAIRRVLAGSDAS